MRGEVGEGCIVSFAVVHENAVLATDAKVFVGTETGVGHGDEGDVRVSQGLGCFAVVAVRI